MMFTFINTSWQGSDHDVTVWRHSLENSQYKFPHPPPSMSSCIYGEKYDQLLRLLQF